MSFAQVQAREGSAVAEERDFDERLAAIARGLVHEPDMPHTLQRIVELAAAHLDGEVYASVSLVQQRRQVDTAAASNQRATRAEISQQSNVKLRDVAQRLVDTGETPAR